MFIDWEHVKNPLLKHPVWSLKDPCITFRDGQFYLFCTVFTEGNHSQVMGVKSSDLKTFSDPLFLWGEGDNGFCSPDLMEIDGVYYLTYQSWDTRPGHDAHFVKIHYSMSQDLFTWNNKHRQIAPNLTIGQRAIDPAIAKHGKNFVATWKEWQTPRMAYAESLDTHAWKMLPDPFGHWVENCQFLNIDGRWHIAARKEEASVLLAMSGTGDDPLDWTKWEEMPEPRFPRQVGFNDAEKIRNGVNAWYVVDWRKHDGYFYTVFCCRNTKNNRGNLDHWLGIARSKDLVNWDFPGGA